MTNAVATKLVKAFAAQSPTDTLKAAQIPRRELFADDVQMEILYCGVCHSDLHQARNEWSSSTYPIVPGHEIVGKVTAVGSAVKGFKVGDMAAVGTMVDSCGVCEECKDHLEVYCDGNVQTYNGSDKHTGTATYGGYSESIVVKEKFVLHLPDGLDAAGAAPLLCAGITLYLAAQTLAGWTRQEGRHSRHRRSWTPRCQNRQSNGCTCGGIYHQRLKSRRR